MLKTSDYYFDLPDSAIAQTPLEDRASSRLMVLDRSKHTVSHHVFSDITSFLKSGDCLVLNNTRVMPARIFGVKDTGASVEFLLLEQRDKDIWQCMVKPGKKAKIGTVFSFGEGISTDGKALMTGEVVDHAEEGTRLVKFSYEGLFENVLDTIGTMPLPPYIHATLKDRERYQTVYNKHLGSAAAPTAGLHFTSELLDAVRALGVHIAYVTLHVGLGTFRPVKVDNAHEHHMHAEWYELTEENAQIIKSAKSSGGRVIAVGTTSTRTLETIGTQLGEVKAASGWTSIFIYPGYTFKVVDALITNFHLPESTLLMLVSALYNREPILSAYRTAVEMGYRFFSFGDAMLIYSSDNN